MAEPDFHGAVWSALVAALNRRPTLLPDPPIRTAEITELAEPIFEEYGIVNVSLDGVEDGGTLFGWIEDPPPKLPG